MIIPIHFKTPDAVHYALESVGWDEEDLEYADYYRIFKQWIQYGECVTLLFDTEKKTLTVKEV
jgi:hypothetical protein